MENTQDQENKRSVSEIQLLSGIQFQIGDTSFRSRISDSKIQSKIPARTAGSQWNYILLLEKNLELEVQELYQSGRLPPYLQRVCEADKIVV